MNRRSIRSVVILIGAMGTALALACSDSTAPVATRIRGNYDFTTTLNSYTYSYRCTSTMNGTMCQDTTVAAGASKLFGTFTLADTAQGNATTLAFPLSNIVLHQADCARATTQCAEQIDSWYSGNFAVRRDSLTLVGDLSGAVKIYLSGQFVDDRFVGTIGWHTYLGCCARQYYQGTFVATRQP